MNLCIYFAIGTRLIKNIMRELRQHALSRARPIMATPTRCFVIMWGEPRYTRARYGVDLGEISWACRLARGQNRKSFVFAFEVPVWCRKSQQPVLVSNYYFFKFIILVFGFLIPLFDLILFMAVLILICWSFFKKSILSPISKSRKTY